MRKDVRKQGGSHRWTWKAKVMDEAITLSVMETNRRALSTEMPQLHLLFKRSHWPKDYNTGLPCCFSEDDGC